MLEFAFDPEGTSNYLPHNFTSPNCVCYTGTHDNETAAGWVKSATRAEKKFAREYLNVKRNKDIPRGMIRAAWASIAENSHRADAGSFGARLGGAHEHTLYPRRKLAVAHG